MKILAIGDFHGKFPKKFEKIIKKEKIDIVVSNGDYPPFYYRKLWFKHCFNTDKDLWEVVGKKKFRELIEKDNKHAEYAIKKLNDLPIPIITVLGNIDHQYSDANDIKKPKGKKYWKWAWEIDGHIPRLLKKYKNIKRFDFSFIKFRDFIFIGGQGGTSPGKVKSKAYKKYKKILDRLFKKFKRENKQRRVIFVTHNVPYNTKIDKIGMKAHSDVRGKHYGSKMVRRIIEKYQPIIHLGGHIHEARGKDKIGRTLCINPGSAHENKAAIITLEQNKKPIVKFI